MGKREWEFAHSILDAYGRSSGWRDGLPNAVGAHTTQLKCCLGLPRLKDVGNDKPSGVRSELAPIGFCHPARGVGGDWSRSGTPVQAIRRLQVWRGRRAGGRYPHWSHRNASRNQLALQLRPSDWVIAVAGLRKSRHQTRARAGGSCGMDSPRGAVGRRRRPQPRLRGLSNNADCDLFWGMRQLVRAVF